MRLPTSAWTLRDGECEAATLDHPLAIDQRVPGGGTWEVELGFGKGRYLLRSAAAAPGVRFLGIELASRYYRLARDRAHRRGLGNILLLRGEALYAISVFLPRAFAKTVHVYFPDPWPKGRHHKRRLLDPGRVDLVVGLLRPGGALCFATDYVSYGELVMEILDGYPGLRVSRLETTWAEGPRTNYEAKYLRQGRPIVRLEARLSKGAEPGALHPLGRRGIVAAVAPKDDGEEATSAADRR